ncbi:MAG: T9SS type A sorting domain-containing protein [Bacteroidetes bacterium]|nr:T9SS type A sorting domain-containing protein [Bacteroidota bacterium]
MKKIFSFIFSLALTLCVSAQFCGPSGSSVCTPGGPYPGLGFYPSYDSVPCAQIGVAYDQKIDMQIPTTIVYLGAPRTLNWVRVDSVENLPCGLCWKTNNASNQFNGGTAGCVRITGTTYDAPGQYKLRIRVSANATVGFPLTLTNQDAEGFGVKFWARVENLDGTCIVVDTLATGNQKHNSGAIATPLIAGTTTICTGGSTTLSLSNAASFYAYKWSNNAVTSSINVTSVGTYTVTAYAACASATASVNVTLNNPSTTITAGGPLTFCQGQSVSLSAGSGFSSYSWSNGATTQQITASTAGSYTCTVTQGACLGTSNTVSVVVNNTTVTIGANGPTTFCQGGSVTLDAGSGYSDYAWSNGATTQTINANAAGTYTVTVTQNGCTASDDEVITITSNTLAPTITASGSTNICPGGSVTLDAGAGYDTYNWSNAETTAEVTINSQGTYTVTVTQGSCSGSASASVAVGNFPLSVTITPQGATTFCPGNSVTLDGGADYDSYDWSTGDNTQTTIANAQGTYTLTATDAGCTGTATISVQVANIPVAVDITANGATTFCAGGSVTLDAGANFDGYNWSNTEQTQTITVNTSGSYIVTVQNDGCVGKDTVDVVVNSNPVPTITPPGNQGICNGSTATLAVQSTFNAYNWTNGSNTQSIVVSNAGSYNVTVTDANGCTGTAVNPVIISINPNPFASVSFSQVGATNDYWLVASPSGATTYSWQYAVNQDTTTGNTINLGGNNDSLDVNCTSEGGFWRVAVTDANGCQDTSGFANVPICVGINDFAGDVQFRMMPNPATDVLYINYELNQSAHVQIQMMDVSGRAVKALLNQPQDAGNQFMAVDISDMAQGVYYIHFSTPQNHFTRKFVIE